MPKRFIVMIEVSAVHEGEDYKTEVFTKEHLHEGLCKVFHEHNGAIAEALGKLFTDIQIVGQLVDTRNPTATEEIQILQRMKGQSN